MPVDDAGDPGRRYRRKRTGRKYVLNPPPPLQPVPVILLALLGFVGVIQAFISRFPLLWGIVAGGCLLGVGYLLVRSAVPVKHYRPVSNRPEDDKAPAAGTGGENKVTE
jgi:hypothetical protein